jgi:hypothetical protein
MKALFFSLITLLTISSNAQSLEGIRQLLQGKWVSVEDTTTRLIIDKDSIYERYYDRAESKGIFGQRVIYRGKTYSYHNSHYILKADTTFLGKSKCSFRQVDKDPNGRTDTTNGYIYQIDDQYLKMDPFSDILTYKRVP